MHISVSSLDIAAIKADFPILKRKIRGNNRLVYLDSGATSQKPNSVLDAERDFYLNHNAAVHRGAHQLAEEATELYEGAREKVANFIGADSNEVIFTKSATESINAIAYSLGNSTVGSRFHLKAGDRIVLSEMEHHANLIPWQELARRTGAELVWFNVTDEGRLDLSNMDDLINPKTKVVALTHQSNVLGTINPLEKVTKRAHEVGALFVLDACQSVPHYKVDVKSLNVDFVTFSGHKMLGPTGVGILWGKKDLLDEMPPFLTGGSMIESVTMESATYLDAPKRFEAGVPNMAQAVGLGAAVDYLNKIGLDRIHAHEVELTRKALEGLQTINGLSIIGPKDLEMRGGVVSFAVDGIHPHDLGQALDQFGIAVRTGHHCAWPLMKRFKTVATTRASFYLYNDFDDISALVEGVERARKYFAER
ncbi:MAG: cysteine desulfurase [Actinobacteria bacterium]|nr:cysteine desulfurase [Actinomycetota bacterium]NCW96592.1 cysteine desulfurase [Actinomycetota bacterium]NCX00364.1 cysteine desulfurase [Actinomycetota bacterium]NCX75668.1 cysteine desulfurase [Actinomycetota bacterium]NDE47622.1 cysteine desulfurase [Actinomycetota bacterium]